MTYVAHRVAHVDSDTTLYNSMPSNHTRSRNAAVYADVGATFGAAADDLGRAGSGRVGVGVGVGDDVSAALGAGVGAGVN
eukprot:2860825-Pyramimonas_sp.AAC.1